MKKLIIFSISIQLSFFSVSASTSPYAQKRIEFTERNVELYNYKLGNLYYTPRISAGFGYDSNSNSSTTSDKDNGYYTSTALSLDLFNQPFQGLTLDTNFTLGYREAFGNNGTSGLILGSDQGDATVGFDYDLNERTTLSFENKASVGIEKLSDAREDENSESHQYWDNDLGVQIHREITADTGISIKTGLQSRRDLKNNADEEEYDENYLGLTLNHAINSQLTLNPFFNYSERDWKESRANNDVDITTYGLSTDYLINDQVNLNFTIAYQELDFDNSAILKRYSSRSTNGFIGSFILSHIATEKFTHSLRGSFNNRPTTIEFSNVSEETQLGYSAVYTVNEKLSLSASFDWIHGEDLGNTPSQLEETYDIYMPAVGARYKFTPRQMIELKCAYQNKTSNSEDLSGNANEYERANIFVNYTYSF